MNFTESVKTNNVSVKSREESTKKGDELKDNNSSFLVSHPQTRKNNNRNITKNLFTIQSFFHY